MSTEQIKSSSTIVVTPKQLKAGQIITERKKNHLAHSCCYKVYLITTVIVLLSFILPFTNCHVDSFLPAGEGKPPLISHVRVSRGPGDGYGLYSDMDSGLMNSGRPYIIKSPSYQHKINHISQFHSNPHSNSHFNLLPTYPVAGIYQKHQKSSSDFDDSANGENPFQLEAMMDDNRDRVDSPTITPFISARALSNMPMFFEHLRANLDAIRESEALEDDDDDESVSVESDEPQKQFDMPSRRGDYFQSDGRLSINTDDEGYGYAYENGGPVTAKPIQNPKTYTGDRTGADASVDLLHLMGRDPKYKKANKYNPSFLFTNLGLGKRSHL